MNEIFKKKKERERETWTEEAMEKQKGMEERIPKEMPKVLSKETDPVPCVLSFGQQNPHHLSSLPTAVITACPQKSQCPW